MQVPDQRLITLLEAAAVKGLVPLPSRIPLMIPASPDPPFVAGKTPVTPDVNGKPVAFGRVIEGAVASTTEPEPVVVAAVS